MTRSAPFVLLCFVPGIFPGSYSEYPRWSIFGRPSKKGEAFNERLTMPDSTAPTAQHPAIPKADHRAYCDIPFVEFLKGVDMQLLQIDIEAGLWVVRIRFAPGVTIPTHKHTGEVFALTTRGSWRYLEYPEVNTAGSYLFEPAGSVHTLHVPASNQDITEAWFSIRGANLNLDDKGEVASVWDASYIRDEYLRLCREAGHGVPPVLGLEGAAE